ncbi:hypothetical protein DY000_02002372 [Brassica cretica]|uniref:Uncharacterized protein n=1 Tax=Brassica cretica TaxID=69181 RepID=A0ABQ7BVT2_BRACR|nr:hypothetical protein DY000_02002372 [Brassica cretica]
MECVSGSEPSSRASEAASILGKVCDLSNCCKWCKKDRPSIFLQHTDDPSFAQEARSLDLHKGH